MAPLKRSEDPILPTRGMSANSTFELTRLPKRRIPTIKDEPKEDDPLDRSDWQPDKSSYWEQHKPMIRKLYIDEKRPLREVVEIMEKDFGFTATPKMYKSRFRTWGWRKYITLDPGTDTRKVQDVIKSTLSEDAGGQKTQIIRLANGQLATVDIKRLQQHIRRKRQPQARQAPLTIRINQPDVFYHTEAIFYSARTHTLSRYEGRLNGTRDTFDIFASEEPIIGRWLRFTDEIQGLMKQQNLSGAIVKMRRAPDEVAAMIKAEPTVLLSNLFMYILKVGHYTAVTPTESTHVRLVVKSLLQYAASLLASSSSGAQATRQLHDIVRGLAAASEGDLGEIASRSWLVILQSCAEISGLDPSAAVAEGSLMKWLASGGQGETDGFWFLDIIRGIVDGTLARLEAAFGRRDFRCIEVLHRKAYLLIYGNTVRRRDFRLDPKLEALYLEMLERGAKGASRAGALRFLAEFYQARGEFSVGEHYAQLSTASMDD
ncbi:hypothetical protein KVR01_007487 [Diaporthe batatas]|uniref:uncharacterized protein n=1 Tax=Diaporthe batatas TaxID=748121 RepID=UPI001D057E1C|nr:uncharacterized protein KVR01_007487 [Diaporthe batatas]KAG8163009.1 hypothetical protein KVR01_007487 [Diaporthe batatas]